MNTHSKTVLFIASSFYLALLLACAEPGPIVGVLGSGETMQQRLRSGITATLYTEGEFEMREGGSTANVKVEFAPSALVNSDSVRWTETGTVQVLKADVSGPFWVTFEFARKVVVCIDDTTSAGVFMGFNTNQHSEAALPRAAPNLSCPPQ